MALCLGRLRSRADPSRHVLRAISSGHRSRREIRWSTTVRLLLLERGFIPFYSA